MTQETNQNDLMPGVILSERSREILIAGRELERVLARHRISIVDFALSFLDKGTAWTVDQMIREWQMHEDQGGATQVVLNKLSNEEKELLWEYFQKSTR